MVGYARVHARPAALAAEQAALSAAGCTTVFADDAKGAAVLRPGLAEALAILRSGDCLAVVALDRLSWRYDALVAVAAEVAARDAHLWSVLDGFDTRSTDAFGTLRALARFAGDVEAARAAETGRADPRHKISAAAVATAQQRVARGELSMSQAATEMGVSRSTLYRRAGAAA